MKSGQTVRAAIFDLGNVVFRASFESTFELWASMSGIPAPMLRSKFSVDEQFEAFERGQLTGPEFAQSLCSTLGIDLTYEQFVAGWNSIYGDVYTEVVCLLQRLGDDLQLLAYTNTNEVHCEIWPVRYRQVLSHFRRVFVSSEIGFRKPELDGFQYVLREAGLEAEEAVFFDDVAANVEAAREVGMRAYLVQGPHSVVSGLEELGLLHAEQ